MATPGQTVSKAMLAGFNQGSKQATATKTLNKAKQGPKSKPQTTSVQPSGTQSLPGAKKGGKVKKSGAIKVHKGETILTARETKKYNRKKASRKRISKRA